MDTVADMSSPDLQLIDRIGLASATWPTHVGKWLWRAVFGDFLLQRSISCLTVDFFGTFVRMNVLGT